MDHFVGKSSLVHAAFLGPRALSLLRVKESLQPVLGLSPYMGTFFSLFRLKVCSFVLLKAVSYMAPGHPTPPGRG